MTGSNGKTNLSKFYLFYFMSFCLPRIPPPLEPSPSSPRRSRRWEVSPSLNLWVPLIKVYYSIFIPVTKLDSVFVLNAEFKHNLLIFLSLSLFSVLLLLSRPISKSLTWLHFMTTSMSRNMRMLWRMWVFVLFPCYTQ